MYILVLSKNKIYSQYFAKGLKYENIPCDPKSFYDKWDNPYIFHQYDGVLCKIDSKTELTNDFIEKIVKASTVCPFFILSDPININVFKKNNNLPIYTYPDSISIRLLAYEIKQYISKKISSNNEESIKIADLVLYLNTHEVIRFGVKYYLRNKEFHLLEFLMRNKDIILSRQKILEHVWDRNANLFTNTVDVHINTLRKKIDCDPKCRLIETIYCLGYIMHSRPKTFN